MDIPEYLKVLIERGDLLGLAAALLVAGVGLYLKFRNDTGGVKPPIVGAVAKIEAVSKRMDGLDKRLARVESDIEHLPTRDELHALELNIVRLGERTVAIERTTESTGRAVGRIEDFMISMKGK